jgi:hypothetical protein
METLTAADDSRSKVIVSRERIFLRLEKKSDEFFSGLLKVITEKLNTCLQRKRYSPYMKRTTVLRQI